MKSISIDVLGHHLENEEVSKFIIHCAHYIRNPSRLQHDIVYAFCLSLVKEEAIKYCEKIIFEHDITSSEDAFISCRFHILYIIQRIKKYEQYAWFHLIRKFEKWFDLIIQSTECQIDFIQNLVLIEEYDKRDITQKTISDIIFDNLINYEDDMWQENLYYKFLYNYFYFCESCGITHVLERQIQRNINLVKIISGTSIHFPKQIKEKYKNLFTANDLGII